MKEKPIVSVGRCGSYNKEAVEAALDELLAPWDGLSQWGGKGKKVFLKVNLLLAVHPDSACTTHPVFTAAVIRAVQKTGAEVFFGDLPGGFHVGTAKAIYEKCGMNKVAEETGANLVRLENFGFRERAIPGGRKMKVIHTPKLLDEMDFIINLPKLKTHMQALYTGAVKNMFGFITTSDRTAAHQYSKFSEFSVALVDIYSALKPSFNIMDAIVGMEGTGPSQGKPVKLNMMFASADAVALDAVAASATGFAPREIMTTVIAGERGLGVADLSRIDARGVPVSKIAKNVKRPSRFVFSVFPLFNDLFLEATKVKPYIKKDECKKCRHCVEVCPVGAIETSAAFEIQDKKCVLCFCCHEVCPHSAVKLKKSAFVRFAEKAIKH